MSTVENVIHFGLGNNAGIDSINIIWPGGKSQTLVNIVPNQTIEVSGINEELNLVNSSELVETIFSPKELQGLVFQHQENNQNDFAFQPLILNMYSQNGPVLATGNIDSRSGVDIYVGNSRGFESVIYKQEEVGVFIELRLSEFMQFEDAGAVFLD